MGSQVRKSKRQLQSELKTIWLEIACGLSPDQIIKKEKLTDKQFSSYLRSLKKDAEKRFQKLNEGDLALASELYLHRMTNLSNSITLTIAQYCTGKEGKGGGGGEDDADIVESHLFEVQRSILNDIQNHEERRIGTALGMKWAKEKVEQERAKKGETAKDIKVTSDNHSHSHTGVS